MRNEGFGSRSGEPFILRAAVSSVVTYLSKMMENPPPIVKGPGPSCEVPEPFSFVAPRGAFFDYFLVLPMSVNSVRRFLALSALVLLDVRGLSMP